MKRVLTFFFLIAAQLLPAQSRQEELHFRFRGTQRSGVLNYPVKTPPKGIVLIIHGDGKTDAVKGQWWYDVRMAINEAGYATYMWDKPGCGQSGGSFDRFRTVKDEAQEVLAAIAQLKSQDLPGSERIGLWGISRAGWVNPVVISRSKQVDFWISVSGVDADETFDYLLEKNLLLEGYSQSETSLLMTEWKHSLQLVREGKSRREIIEATPSLQKNAFWNKINGEGLDEASYLHYQKILQNTPWNEATGMPYYVEDLDSILREIRIPVLAFFGESDTAVDWCKTKELYQATLGKGTDLTIRQFEQCDHNMWTSATGNIFAFEEEGWAYVRCPGFLEGITTWLKELEF